MLDHFGGEFTGRRDTTLLFFSHRVPNFIRRFNVRVKGGRRRINRYRSKELGNQLVIYDVLYVCVCILVVVGPLFLLLLLLLFFSDKQSSQMRYFGWTCSNRTLCCCTSLCAFESYSPEKSGEKIKRQWFTLILFFFLRSRKRKV